MDEPTCGHPKECWEEEDDEIICQWCEENKRAWKMVGELTAVIEKQAIVLYKGSTVFVEGEIGYMALYGGTVHQTPPGAISAFHESLTPDA